MRKYILLSVLILFSVVIEGSKWSRTGDVNTWRSGSESAMLTDGRIITISGMEIDTTSSIWAGTWSGNGFQNYEVFSPATGKWVQGALTTGGEHTLAMLLPDGTVLWVNNAGNSSIYDPATNTWSAGYSFGGWQWRACGTLLEDGKILIVGRDTTQNCILYDWNTKNISVTAASTFHHSAEKGTSGMVELILPDGKVLLIGGKDSTKCDVYDPVGQTWTNTGSLNRWRRASVGIYLRTPWDKVLVAGGTFGGAETELWDPNTGIWTNTGNLNVIPRSASAMVLLPNGKPMIMGGANDYLPTLSTKKCEVFEPDSGVWRLTDSLEYATRWGRSHFPAAVLYTGKILAISGHDSVAQHLAVNRYGLNYSCEIYDPSNGIVDSRMPLNIARFCHTATPLPIIHTATCSTNVLVVGGENVGGILKSCEIYNYNLDIAYLTDSLNIERTCHATVLLPSGKVLTIGGRNFGGTLKSCELYDITAGTWSLTDSLEYARFNHTTTSLKDGRVFVTGGESGGSFLNSCEIYDPNTNTWTTTNSLTNSRAYHSAILLFDGRVLVVGGQSSGGAITSCEIWDPGTTNWTSTGSLTNARYSNTSILLQSGNVLVVGGTNGSTALASCEVYNSATGVWSSETSLNNARYRHNSVLLYSGLILTIGGYNGTSDVQTWEVYDPATHKWKSEGTISGRHYNTSTLVSSDKPYVLMIGGKDAGGTDISSINRYDVGLGYRSEWQSTITNCKAVTQISPSMHIEGTLFRDYSEADGGNHCHIVSSDHPIMSFVRIGGGNWQGNGGGEMMYMPSSHSWDKTHTDVDFPDTAAGYYRVWSIVNGIPCKWYQACAGTEEESNSKFSEQNSKITIYPNPSTGIINFDLRAFDTAEKTCPTIDIYDCSGRLVKTLRANNFKVQNVKLNGLKSGIYFYSVQYKNIQNKGKFTLINNN
ncbi:MAG: kelch repeat-containing protein [bacterium]